MFKEDNTVPDPIDVNIAAKQKPYQHVIMGGTFDRLHNGCHYFPIVNNLFSSRSQVDALGSNSVVSREDHLWSDRWGYE